jgi:hypothetical protein
MIALVSPQGSALAVWTSDKLEQKWSIVGDGTADGGVRIGICVLVLAGTDCGERRTGDVVQQLILGAAARVPVGIVSDAAAGDWRWLHLQLEPPERGLFLVADWSGPGPRSSGRVRAIGRGYVWRRADHWNSWSAHESDRAGTAFPLTPGYSVPCKRGFDDGQRPGSKCVKRHRHYG